MHDSHDLDLIADYADGSRDPAAEELLASCADCRAELEMHRQIRSVLSSAPLPSMTDEERVAMRAGVHAQLDAGAPVVSLDSRRQRRWLQLGSVAAAMFVTVGVAGVLTQGGGGDDAATVALEESARQSNDADGGAAADATTAADFATEMASPETATETTAAGATATTAATAGDVGVLEAMEVGQAVTFPDPISRDRLDAHLTATVEWLESQSAEQLDAAWFSDREVPTPACFSSEVDPVFAVVNATVDGQAVEVFVALDPETGQYRSDIYEVDGCTLIE